MAANIDSECLHSTDLNVVKTVPPLSEVSYRMVLKGEIEYTLTSMILLLIMKRSAIACFSNSHAFFSDCTYMSEYL